jgi:hypothetical protein
VGKLNFLIQAQLDISFTLNMVRKFSKKLQTFQLNAMKHSFKYIKGIIDLGICYCHGEVNVLKRFSNVNWAKDFQDQKSTTNYLFILGCSSITWGNLRTNHILPFC